MIQIFGHLMPLDVLRLARTTKQFRRMLMHRSSVSIWIAARRNVPNLPDCPPYASEPQFANLVFDTHCHVRFILFYSASAPDHICRNACHRTSDQLTFELGGASVPSAPRSGKCHYFAYILYSHWCRSMVEEYSLFVGESVYKSVPSRYGSE